MNEEINTISEEQVLHNKLSFEINQELIHLMKRIVELQQENKRLKDNAENNDKVVDKVNWENMLLKKENEQLKDNWNNLKEIAKSQSGFKKQADLKGGLWFEIDELLDKIQELEKGSDINE